MIMAEKNEKHSLVALILFCFSLLPLPCVLGLVPIVRFAAEEIDVDVFPGEIEVTGFYEYRNPWPLPVSQAYTIPFPIDAAHPEPYYLEATNLSDSSKQIQIEESLGENRFKLFFLPGQQTKIKVTYRQACLNTEACYLLKTTQPWKAPLEHGEYKIFLHGVKNPGSNYELRPLTKNVYCFVRNDFMPSEDWHFSWSIN